MYACNPRSGETETDAWAVLASQLLYSSFFRTETLKEGGQAHDTWKEGWKKNKEEKQGELGGGRSKTEEEERGGGRRRKEEEEEQGEKKKKEGGGGERKMKNEEEGGEGGGGRTRNVILENVDIWKFLEDHSPSLPKKQMPVREGSSEQLNYKDAIAGALGCQKAVERVPWLKICQSSPMLTWALP